MNLANLKVKLNEKEVFRKACPGRFLFWPYWKKSYEKYISFPEKYICLAYDLREFQYDEYLYKIIAYSTKGDLSDATVLDLKSYVFNVEVNQIRFESHGTNGFFPLQDVKGISRNGEDSLTGIYNSVKDVFIIIVQTSIETTDEINCSQIVQIRKNKEIWHWALANKYLPQ